MYHLSCYHKRQRLLALALLMITLFVLFYSGSIFADDKPADDTLGGFASNINNAIPAMTTLIASIGYLGGIGFAVAGIIKFKQHKDTPHQVTLGTPIVMLLIAAALIFLPTMIASTGKTIAGKDGATMGSPDKGGNGKEIWNLGSTSNSTSSG